MSPQAVFTVLMSVSSVPAADWPAGISEMGSSTEVAPVDVHQALAQVRRLPEYQPPPESFWKTLSEQPQIRAFFENLRDQISNLFERLAEFLRGVTPDMAPDLGGLPNTVTQVLTWTVSALAAFLVLVGIYYLLTYLRRRMEHRTDTLKPLNKPFEATMLVTSRHHWEQAQSLARQGVFDQAVRQIYFALLCLLNERQWALYDESRTNWEYLNLMRHLASKQSQGAGDLVESFQRIACTFEDSRYGHLPVLAETFEQSAQAYQRLEGLSS